ncbi:ribosome biogenesis protein Kri1 [Ophiocordyceps camponoti-floridani]|uniref:Ribosome biogenesis protein Kri1 n=1 Tax=Ophiocordyceps camponoti-floridani TaxID=2030778 RepID=A0A8H4Q9H6_9HYPO|nr:ribosome biogenesis protein Kri1 [Ophiocordyceps camponoti-floridani]
MARDSAAPLKRKILQDSDSDSDGDCETGGADLKINEEYARRFEHNKKREEREKLQKKYGDGDASSSSDDETEDEDGFLATEDLDAQISATLKAIRTKDPRVYDKSVTFIELPEDTGENSAKGKKEKPVFLRDYQREKLLRGDVGASDGEEEEEEEDALPTYVEEQKALKKSILSEIHASRPDGESDSSDDEGFMKRKEPEGVGADGVHPSRKTGIKPSETEVASADKDPEKFLSNFMASRAWIPEEGTKWKVFDSDDGESDAEQAAEKWEHAYNMRFEDPSKSNEVLRSYARDLAAARSVRRQEKTGRQRQREAEREKKEQESRRKAQEKARLRKLKLDESAERLRLVKQAAGAVGKKLREEDWMRFLDEAWDNDKWEEEMRKRFGDEYYALDDEEPGGGVEDEDDDEEREREREKKKKKKSKRGPKKPKWDDDIDIKDIVPDFEDDAEKGQTSPQSFGMTALDILLAPSDQSLNQFAGLKKLAPFRDAAKKRRDGRLLAKRARLRQWRKEVFGSRRVPTLGAVGLEEEGEGEGEGEGQGQGEKKTKRKRKRKGKDVGVGVAVQDG